MIDGLISGHLCGAPQLKSGKDGKTFVEGKVLIDVGDGEGIFVRVFVFGNVACNALLALDGGDAVALAGGLTPTVWTDKTGKACPGMDLFGQQVLTAYHAQSNRKAMDNELELKSIADLPMADVPFNH
jgi:hypothetical protein